MNTKEQNYKWYILALVVLSDMFIIAIPMMGMSVMAKEIADDLKLTLVQVGAIWGAGGILGILREQIEIKRSLYTTNIT